MTSLRKPEKLTPSCSLPWWIPVVASRRMMLRTCPATQACRPTVVRDRCPMAAFQGFPDLCSKVLDQHHLEQRIENCARQILR